MTTTTTEQYRVAPATRVNLLSHPADETNGAREEQSRGTLDQNARRLAELQETLTAESKRAILIVLQAMDTGGKDPTIRDVFSAVNPAYCVVHAFKKASKEEEQHDFLWRFHQKMPAYGEIGVFNRSYYEIVLGARVNGETAGERLRQRYREINQFEQYLAENDITVLKFFFHISKDEQKRRLQERLDDPKKNWELSEADFVERRKWDDYMRAFEGMLAETSTHHAPWFLIPADQEWFRNIVVSQIIVETMEAMDLQYPPPSMDVDNLEWE